MSVPKKKRTSGSKGRRASHFSLEEKNMVKAEGELVPHKYKKAVTLKKKIKSN